MDVGDDVVIRFHYFSILWFLGDDDRYAVRVGRRNMMVSMAIILRCHGVYILLSYSTTIVCRHTTSSVHVLPLRIHSYICDGCYRICHDDE